MAVLTEPGQPEPGQPEQVRPGPALGQPESAAAGPRGNPGPAEPGLVLGRLRHVRVGRYLQTHPKLVDGMLAAGLSLIVFAALLDTLAKASGTRQLTVLGLAALELLLVVWRRQFPMVVLAACLAVAGVQALIGSAVASNFGVLVAFYTAAAQGTRRVRRAATVAMAVATVVGSIAWRTQNHAPVPANLIVLGLVVVTAGVLGRNAGTRRAYLASLTDRADRLERERDQQAQIAAAAERARIAREMHDVVAHNLSVMIALADGAEFALDSSVPQAKQAIMQVSRTGREALAEMRRLLGVLRADGAADGTAPQPRLTDLDALIGQVRQAGLPVLLTVTGKPLDLPAGVQLTIYRLVQEALTNTLKHAGPAATAAVELRYDRRGITVDVRDTGQGANPAGGPAAPGGQGLVGMRERSAVYGGTVQVGPGPDGGWRVSTWIAADGKVPG
ncbi:sensor histidine kinase [Frankia sp. AgB32]|uniref:sensor histidine kinase n=1 Tax=Frankia sp. AgB32 TaxID=631119 RepID=UPI00200F3ABE|nr:histidine kinase [Frankia sp. AgB32]MCK9897742.1 histidine kinase [Frankia sp. AgB32]